MGIKKRKSYCIRKAKKKNDNYIYLVLNKFMIQIKSWSFFQI